MFKAIRRIFLCLLTLFAPIAYASSNDSWAEFRKEVAQACTTAAKAHLHQPVATVDPFGSESYGLAVVRGKAPGKSARSQETRSIICVFDKRTKKVELGSELKIN